MLVVLISPIFSVVVYQCATRQRLELALKNTHRVEFIWQCRVLESLLLLQTALVVPSSQICFKVQITWCVVIGSSCVFHQVIEIVGVSCDVEVDVCEAWQTSSGPFAF